MNINVALSADRNYCKLLATAMVSLFENNHETESITVYCLLFKPGKDYINEIINLGKRYRRNIIVIETCKTCEKHRFWEQSEDGRYVRLLLPKLLDRVDKVLYLDCDVMIRRNLKDLFSIDISQYYHAAVLDTVRKNARMEAYIDNLDTYFNSGVMLINLKKWREDDLVGKFKHFKLLHSDKGIYRDQRVLNGTTASNFLILPPSYNFMPEFYQFTAKQIKEIAGTNQFYSQEEIDSSMKNPHIVHFSGRSIDRPWYSNSHHKYTEEYRSYMNLCSFTSYKLKHDKLRNVVMWNIKRFVPFPILKHLILRKNSVL